MSRETVLLRSRSWAKVSVRASVCARASELGHRKHKHCGPRGAAILEESRFDILARPGWNLLRKRAGCTMRCIRNLGAQLK